MKKIWRISVLAKKDRSTKKFMRVRKSFFGQNTFDPHHYYILRYMTWKIANISNQNKNSVQYFRNWWICEVFINRWFVGIFVRLLIKLKCWNVVIVLSISEIASVFWNLMLSFQKSFYCQELVLWTFHWFHPNWFSLKSGFSKSEKIR